jgi:hypothetical protein
MRIARDDEKIGIGDNRNAWSARQLQRVLARSLEEAGQCAMQRERAMNAQTALRSGGAPRRRPDDSFDIDRAASDPIIWSKCLGRGADGTAEEAHHGANGLAHKRRQQSDGVHVGTGALRRDVNQFSVCALTPIRQREYAAFPQETQHANAAERSTALCGIGRNAVRPNVLTRGRRNTRRAISCDGKSHNARRNS